MANYARVIGGVAIDISKDPKADFHPDIAVEFTKVPEKVTHGWRLVDGKWLEPLVLSEPVVAPQEPETPEAPPADQTVTKTP